GARWARAFGGEERGRVRARQHHRPARHQRLADLVDQSSGRERRRRARPAQRDRRMSTPLQVVAVIDGPAVGVDTHPFMLDGPLAWVAWQRSGLPMDTSDPVDFDLPLGRWEIGGTWGWQCSAGV